MNSVLLILAAAVILAAAGFGFWTSWRRRLRRDSVLTVPEAPTDLGALKVAASVLYVATTPANDPFERLALPRLAYRASGHLQVHDTGVVIRLVLEPTSFLPAMQILSVGEASHAIDRGVEHEGLICITWLVSRGDGVPSVKADTYLRVREWSAQRPLLEAIAAIACAVDPDVAASPALEVVETPPLDETAAAPSGAADTDAAGTGDTDSAAKTASAAPGTVPHAVMSRTPETAS